MDDRFDIRVEMEQYVAGDGVPIACLRRSGFSSIGGVCHNLEIMVLHNILSPAPDIATGASLSPWLSQKQETVSS